MPGLLLGPLLRHVDDTSATIWVETDAACEVTVLGTAARTFTASGHHFALVVLAGLTPATTTPYEVALDGVTVWPETSSPYPAGRIRTLGGVDAPVRLVFGSCRYARPATVADDSDFAPDALDTFAARMAGQPDTEWPDALLLLGDQVYADETTPHTQAFLRHRRDLSVPPGVEVADFEEYTHLYLESWTDPDVRWLMANVPTSMVFDDHDVRDDWNTSELWRRDMQATSWWRERIIGALSSYWIYQHLGNLSPAGLAENELWAAVQAADGDVTPLLRDFAEHADAEADGAKGTRWSYRRDFGRVRLLVIDTRCGRILADGARSMVGEEEFGWIEEQTKGDFDHLLVGSSLPWLMPYAVHDIEAWNEQMCTRHDGRRRGRWSEKLRRFADLEHWASFRLSFDRLARLFERVGSRVGAPATICVLSGDVHHAYIAVATYPPAVTSGVYQLTCSPVHNAVPGFMKIGFRLGWSRFAHALTTRWNTAFGLSEPPMDWAKTHGPYFDNQLTTLTLQGRRAHVRIERTESAPDGEPRMVEAVQTVLRSGG